MSLDVNNGLFGGVLEGPVKRWYLSPKVTSVQGNGCDKDVLANKLESMRRVKITSDAILLTRTFNEFEECDNRFVLSFNPICGKKKGRKVHD